MPELLHRDWDATAVIRGENSATPGEVVPCPGPDESVRAGDWTAVIGTSEELAERGITVKPPAATRVRRLWLRRMLDAARILPDELNPVFYPVMASVLILLIGSTILLRFAYRRPPGMTWVDALYFSTETITTTGYGDYSFLQQPTWLRLYAAMMMFAGVTTTALLVAFIADLLLSRRFVRSAGSRRARHLRNHIIVVGLSPLGMRVVTELTTAGYDVAVIERDETNRFLESAAELDVPVIFGDATLDSTLELARVDRARAVAVLTRDDMINIETGIVLLEMLVPGALHKVDRTDVPLVLRVYDRTLGFAVAQRFGFENVRSTDELAAPWFIGAAMGLQVLGTFSVGQSSFMVGAMHVAEGSELDGRPIPGLSTKIRVIAITRGYNDVTLHPRRGTRLSAGDTVYLVGPYRELLATLRQGRASEPEADSGERLPAPAAG
ncbi:NAD-binding protein [Mycobacterium sp. SM1]|nr:NAD-binding protein [Mycobacterium sp. SM1]